MKLFNFVLIFLLFIFVVSCSTKPIIEPVPQPNQPYNKPVVDMLQNPLFCNVDADCICGGIDRQTNDCFIGNKLYADYYVDNSQQCPDFCTGIAGNLETKCVDHVCKTSPMIRACTEEAKVCPDGSVVVRQGPDCEFAKCLDVECTVDADCVFESTCHPTKCVPRGQETVKELICTAECRPGTLDCGGSCACIDDKCVGQNYFGG
ncbi:hypothetical protein COV18_06820 [Candidatus Woesearchaeota archaeon CG10_big_fil_rev_8_21_14_0_10_37_12]|nr:MAG: hypothetical protein COV18_06820 [Candidatus Woesearchaeota archaeon CG10_big_fil_rev_8_21_14_0_10_37_12]